MTPPLLWRAPARARSWLYNQQRRLSRVAVRRRPRKVFVTFADGDKFTNHYLVQDVQRLGIFDEVHGLGPEDLGEAFWQRHGDFVRAHAHGYGCWIWKIWILWQTLRRLQADDILVYADAGCVVSGDVAAQEAMESMFATLQHAPGGIAARPMRHLDIRRMCKADVLRALDVSDGALAQMVPFMSNKYILRHCPMTMRILDVCADFVQAQRYELFDDTPSRAPNVPQFVSHRHDQAVFSLLLNRYGCVPWEEADDMFHAARLGREDYARTLGGEGLWLWDNAELTDNERLRSQALIRRWLAFRRAHGALPAGGAALLETLPDVAEIPELGA